MLQRLFIATFLLEALACSDTASVDPDADAPNTGSITVRLGPSNGGIHVFTSAPDGELLFSTTTDDDGNAELVAQQLGMVSVSNPSGLFGFSVMTFIGVELGTEIQWPLVTNQDTAAQSLQVNMPDLAGAETYSVFTCDDSRDALYSPTAELTLSEACLEAETVPVMAFAQTSDEPIAYSFAELPTQEAIAAPVELSWRTDFSTTAIDFHRPGGNGSVAISGCFEFGSFRVKVPAVKFETNDSLLPKPPGEAELLWTEMTSFGAFGTWQKHQGPLPSSDADWVLPASAIAIHHDAEQTPKMVWAPSGDGAVVSGLYLWQGEQQFSGWSFLASKEASQAIFPELPSDLPSTPGLGEEPVSGDLYLSTIDYADLDDFHSGLASGILIRSVSAAPSDDYLAEGGIIASATIIGGLN